ncbi:ABC transporter permease [Clostridium tagluense]|uniref:FtsX-like permease family protein n=1 Tax=Clostridium tagluense TaxID=360422 RepID=UPI001CF13998|nr:FtsX-like permease family protein [Clostridium tagluense]MCB2312415.1 ABC transporter permease [Clostridium tagluense]MCB2317090.1 ABC transporter permease [Clostridium tagluense]MCB2321883.1 ABC transporter permease [Clostridium tagluense]MCB2326798.1 ABC transporter permease [Clostridium tagluense]MCB2331610.1 ABC transporter permease [Clostridium tagluense]
MTLNKLALNNVVRDKWTYFAYFLSSMFSVFIFFTFAVSMFHPDLSIIEGGSALSMAMAAGATLVYVFSFMFISYSVRAFMKSRKKTLGLFTIMGASKKQLNKMIFKENMLIGVAAIITAIIFGLVFSPFFLMLAKKIMVVEGFAMYVPIKAILLTFGMFFILFLIISLVSPIFIGKEKVIKMLKSDKTDEKEMVFSLLFMIIGVLIILSCIFIFLFYSKVDALKAFMDTGMGTWLMFGVPLVAIYILYVQISILIIESMKKRKMYHRRTNMIIIADIKSKLRENVKMMYLITILFTVAFYTIVMLYAQNIDVEKNTKANFPLNYIYVSQSNNNHEKEHVKLLQDALSKKSGYEEYKYKVKYKGEDNRNGIMSESEYNLALKGTYGKSISLKKNEVYIVSGSPKIMPPNYISNQIKRSLEKEGVTPIVAGISKQNITPSGFFDTITIFNDEILRELDRKETYNVVKIYGYNTNSWKEEGNITKKLKSKIIMEKEYKFGFFSANELLETEKNSKNLMLYVGFSISLIFVIAALSMIYFRLITELEKECVKFKGIVKLGLSKKELSKIISTQNFILMFVPFLVALILLFIGIGSTSNNSGKSYFTVALSCSAAFLMIQSMGYIMVNSKYKKAVFKEVI